MAWRQKCTHTIHMYMYMYTYQDKTGQKYKKNTRRPYTNPSHSLSTLLRILSSALFFASAWLRILTMWMWTFIRFKAPTKISYGCSPLLPLRPLIVSMKTLALSTLVTCALIVSQSVRSRISFALKLAK